MSTERQRTDGTAAEADPLAGIPDEVIAAEEPYDTDTAGGCG